MITEANRHEVTMLLANALGAGSKFSALSLALMGIEDDDSRSSIDELLRAYQADVDTAFNRLAALLGYTVKAEEVTR
ncbi:MAG: hypothetical protein AAAC47_17150 [Pararhizobium sp.]